MKTLKKLGSMSGVAACTAALLIGVVALADGTGSGSSDPCGSGAASCDCVDNGTTLHTCCSPGKCKKTQWDTTILGVTIHHCKISCTA